MFLLKKKKKRCRRHSCAWIFRNTAWAWSKHFCFYIQSTESLQWIHGSKAAERHLTAQIQTSALPRILRSFSLRLSFSHPLTFHLYLRLNVLPPRFQYAVLHPSFLRRFHLPSLYISLTHFQALFAFSFSPLRHPLRCPSPSKAIILLPFSLYLHDTKVLSQAGADGKRQAFTKRFRFNIFPLLFITTQELHSRTNSPLVIALSFCKYHGPSLIFILLPPLSLKTPSEDQYCLGLRASRRQSYIIHPCPVWNIACETQTTSSVWHDLKERLSLKYHPDMKINKSGLEKIFPVNF